MKLDTALLAIVILAFIAVVSSCNGAVNSEFLNAVKMIESGGNPHAIGDRGKAIGPYQMHMGSWLDVSEHRAKKRLKVYPYSQATNEFIGRVYAKTYLQMLATSLKKALGRDPSKAEILVAYQCGFTSFKKRGLNLANVPTSTKLAVQKLK